MNQITTAAPFSARNALTRTLKWLNTGRGRVWPRDNHPTKRAAGMVSNLRLSHNHEDHFHPVVLGELSYRVGR
jgi:hypothetical protein